LDNPVDMLEASTRDPLSGRAKITSVIFAVPRRIHSRVSRRTAFQLYGVAKTTIVVMTVAVGRISASRQKRSVVQSEMRPGYEAADRSPII
jgi:hypothetical protein